jgi:hypothetical protein
VAGFNRNQWQVTTGISGKFRPESVADFNRNMHALRAARNGASEAHGETRVMSGKFFFYKQQFPLMTYDSYTTYVGGGLLEPLDHPFLSF